MQPFVIYTRARCGSTMLQTALDAHPMIQCKGEVFGGVYIPGTWPVKLRDAFKARRSPYAVGFKLMGWQPQVEADQEPIRAALRAIPGLRVIHLQRRNMLAAFVSEQLAQQTGRWHLYGKTKSASPPRVCVNIDAIITYLKGTEDAYQSQLHEFRHQESLLVHYERFLADFDGTCRSIQRFLGVPTTTLRPRTQKLENRAMKNIVVNYRELLAALCGTRWEIPT